MTTYMGINVYTLFTYKNGGYARGGEQVAEKMIKDGYNPSDYWWASVHDGDVNNNVVVWSKHYGDSICRLNVFVPSDDHDFAIDDYLDGLIDGKFSPEIAAKNQKHQSGHDDEDFAENLARLKKSEKQIVSIGEDWLTETDGEEIPTLESEVA